VILELKNSPAVPADCLASFEKLLLRRLKIMLLKLVRSSLEEGNFPLALQTAQIFMLNLQEKKVGFLLSACIKMCHKNSLFHRFFKLASQAYRWLRRGKAKIIQV
jgi:hypothetical protein